MIHLKLTAKFFLVSKIWHLSMFFTLPINKRDHIGV